MSELATTLEQMQYDILQGDLSQNPYLQSHVIASKDKELKTSAKKIIPAINELLKRLEVCEITVTGFTAEIDGKLTAFESVLKEALTEAFREEMEKRLEALEQQQAQLITAAVSEQIKSLIDSGEVSTGGEVMKKTFVEKIELARNESKTITSITQEELFPENIVIYEDGVLLPKGIDQKRGSSTSAYDVEILPLKITNIVGGLQFKNAINEPITVLVYKYE